MTQAAAGCRESFDELVRRYRRRVYNLVRALTSGDSEAEDLVQDTMLNAFRAYDGLRTNACLKAWLMTIMRNAWISKYRTTTRRPPETLLSDVSRGQSGSAATIVALGSNSAESEVLRYVLDPDLAVAFGRLSDEMRTTMFYVAVGGMRCQEVAKIMGVPINTVLTRVHRSKNALRRSLSELSEER